jgi:hypothetical protein
MQMRTYRDGTRWLRWLAPLFREQPTPAIARQATDANCAACDTDDPAWSDAPGDSAVPKVDLVFECGRCGRTTLQGRLAAAR